MGLNSPVKSEQCRVCNADALIDLYCVNNYQLATCQTCNFAQVIHLDELIDLAEIYGEEYFESAKYDDTETQSYENNRRIKLLQSVLGNTQTRVLDAGCATGDFIASTPSNFEMWGVDISPVAVAEAQRQNPGLADRLTSTPLEQISYEDSFFDAIVLWDVIEHVRDPVGTCRALMRCLKPGGYLLLSTPDIGSLAARLLRRRWAFMTPPEHLGFFSSKSFKYLLETALAMNIVTSCRRGKWVNSGFLAYKLRRVFPELVPAWMVNRIRDGWLGQFSLYVPTQDIRYIISQKKRG